MNKIQVSKIYIIIAAIVICILVALLIRFQLNQRKIQAFVSPIEILVGEIVNYSDSTSRADHWRWEFGNGDVVFDQKGTYRYKAPGVYQVRLVIDESLQKDFFVNVKEPIKLNRDSTIKIIAPNVAIQGELVTFRAEGVANEWRWQFGETSMTDSREQVAIYSFMSEGIYDVELMTDNTLYPIIHTIEVLPGYIETGIDNDMILMGNDIREKLQAIADGKPFNVNYDYIVSKYLCDSKTTTVIINDDKRNDFYSYCQGLRMLGLRNTMIIEVKVVLKEGESGCVQRLVVNQHSDLNER